LNGGGAVVDPGRAKGEFLPPTQSS